LGIDTLIANILVLRLYCACAKRPYFHSRSKIWRHHRVPLPRFPARRVHLLYMYMNVENFQR